ncbi:hypothetical protein OH77DRAFT_1257276 [Trametes cingulata]|nr:hypothetical protein OH77DRAFT_1257276 [Trametes cingulata]
MIVVQKYARVPRGPARRVHARAAFRRNTGRWGHRHPSAYTRSRIVRQIPVAICASSLRTCASYTRTELGSRSRICRYVHTTALDPMLFPAQDLRSTPQGAPRCTGHPPDAPASSTDHIFEIVAERTQVVSFLRFLLDPEPECGKRSCASEG